MNLKQRLFETSLALIALSPLGCSGEQVVVREVEARCGNATIETGEACDDGNQTETDACTTGCKFNRCGDGVLRTDLEVGVEGHEACDDGNDFSEDG
jgi:cysteine-rich repeat protein